MSWSDASGVDLKQMLDMEAAIAVQGVPDIAENLCNIRCKRIYLGIQLLARVLEKTTQSDAEAAPCPPVTKP